MARITTAGVGDMVAGKLEEIKGRLTGSRAEVVKGKARQAKGYARVSVQPPGAAWSIDNLARPRDTASPTARAPAAESSRSCRGCSASQLVGQARRGGV
jgi:hypothetical protein